MLQRYIRDELAEVLVQCRGAEFEQSDKRIRVLARDAGGFDVTWIDAAPEFIVCFAGWHATMGDAQSAVRLFALGLTRRCRLTIELIGARPRRWLVERQEAADDAWHEIGETSHLTFKLWRPLRVVQQQNDWIDPAALGHSPAKQQDVAAPLRPKLASRPASRYKP